MNKLDAGEIKVSSATVLPDSQPHPPSVALVPQSSTLSTAANDELGSTVRETPGFQTVSNPPARYLPALFWPYMVSAIRRNGNRAHIEISFLYVDRLSYEILRHLGLYNSCYYPRYFLVYLSLITLSYIVTHLAISLPVKRNACVRLKGNYRRALT